MMLGLLVGLAFQNDFSAERSAIGDFYERGPFRHHNGDAHPKLAAMVGEGLGMVARGCSGNAFDAIFLEKNELVARAALFE